MREFTNKYFDFKNSNHSLLKNTQSLSANDYPYDNSNLK